MYHPLLLFDGESGHPICAILRAGNTHGSHLAVAILKRIVARLRHGWPGVELEIRADAGFAVPTLYEYCEEEHITYTAALITNYRLKEIAEDLLEEAKERHDGDEQEEVKPFSEDLYQAGSWEHERPGHYKAEVMEQGTNTRFIVSTRTDAPEELYEFYTRRGESENWIKDFKLHIEAGRLSCSGFIANQFRLLVHAAAYWLLDTLRRKLVRSGVRRMQMDTLRLMLIKIGGRVKELVTKVRLHLAWGHHGQPIWHALSLAFEAVHELFRLEFPSR